MNATASAAAPEGVRDWLAILLVGAGSSYARGPDREDVIERVQRIAVSDWSSLYDLAGQEATVNVVDVTGYDKVWWDARGVHTDTDPAKDAALDVQQVKVTLPKKRRR